jgi:hypothetical protein
MDVLDKIIRKDEIIVYHGSRGGIVGEIKPTSRIRCDFGCGFYMGTNPEQVKGLIVEDSSPVFYTLKINLKDFDRNKILILDGMDWVYSVLANRQKIKEFNNLDIVQQIINKQQDYDFMIGAIADDRMNEAMRRFQMNGLTDIGLKACLESIDYGYQIVAKSEKACKRIEILSEKDIYGLEADNIRRYVNDKRKESQNVVETMNRKYLREGQYLSEIIENHQKQ